MPIKLKVSTEKAWDDFRKLVRLGAAEQYYPVGTILYDNMNSSTGVAFQVVQYYDYNDGQSINKYFDPDLLSQGYTKSVLLLEVKLTYGNSDNIIQFDAAEAFLYAEQEISPNTYRVQMPPGYDETNGGGKWYCFTTTKTIPIGGQITLSWGSSSPPASISTYSSSTSTSALDSAKALTEWDGVTEVTSIGTIKFAPTYLDDSPFGKLNNIRRARYGSNNYYQSGLRQALNSESAANTWWQPSNIFDRPYAHRSLAGRLYLLDSGLKSVLATPEVKCITNNDFEYPSLDGTTFPLQTEYTVRDKIFLPTHTELNLSSSPNVGNVLTYYTGANNAKRLKYRKTKNPNDPYYYWFRTPYPSYCSYVRHVYASGALNNNDAYNSIGVAAACIIQ